MTAITKPHKQTFWNIFFLAVRVTKKRQNETYYKLLIISTREKNQVHMFFCAFTHVTLSLPLPLPFLCIFFML